MKTIVLKFGGTSVGSIDRIKKVSKIIEKYKKKGNRVLVVSSAMSGETNKLIKKSKLISKNFDKAEYDVLLSTGEQLACSLIAGRLKHLGLKARSWMSWQIPILTVGPYSSARIEKIITRNLLQYLKSGGIPIVTGFQGINNFSRLTTIGRSGSDASAIMIAKFLKAEECIIYTDVEGVYTTDPRLHNKAKKINQIEYDEMLEMASLGSKIMQPTSVQDGKLNNININVRSSFINRPGTLITKSFRKKDFTNRIITGISSTRNDAKITIAGVKDKPGVAAHIFEPLSKNLINVDMVVQNISLDGKETDLTFTIKSEDVKKTEKIIMNNKNISYKKLSFAKNLAKISIIGVGMITTPGITYRMFKALASKRINIMVISTSEIKISVLISSKFLKKAIGVLHKEFKLD